MAIVTVDGRPRSVRTDEERVTLLTDDIERLPDYEREALHALFQDLARGDFTGYRQLVETEYDVVPVGPREFLTNPYFLGETGASLWPRLADDVVELFEGEYQEAVFSGSLGWGKSFLATTVLAYVVYQMSCLKSPQRAYGIDPGSHLYIAMLSLTERVAKNVVVKELLGKITHSPYFKEHFPFKAAPSNLEIRFPKSIQIVGGSTSSSAIIGLNVFSGFIDEASFFGEIKKMDRQGKIVAIDQGQAIYKSITRRMKSRFQRVGRLPGLLILASSKENPNAFIEKRIVQAQENNDPYVFVREYATWDVRPREHFSPKSFDVVVGNDRVASRILTGDLNERERYEGLGLKIVSVPEDYRLDFEGDIDGCLTGDTEVALLDGASVPIRELVGRREFWVYSYGSDGRLYPGRGYDARLTRENADVFAVVLDDDSFVKCTGNHLFMLRDGSYKRADELQSGDSLMPLYRKLCRYGYEMVKSNVGGRWVHTHRIIAREGLLGGEYPPDGYVIHHRNRDCLDNSPVNLQVMTAEEHYEEHTKYLHEGLLSPESKAKCAEVRRHSPACLAARRAALVKAREVYVGTDKHIRVASQNGRLYGWGSSHPNILKSRSENGTRNITKLNNSERNPSKKPENRKKSSERLKRMPREQRVNATYRGLHARWHDGVFEDCEVCQSGIAEKLKEPNNHKVVGLVYVGRHDVYDISVEHYHNFALTAGVVVHNSLRDIAGVATQAVSNFMNRTEKVVDLVDASLVNPIGDENDTEPQEEWVANRPLNIRWGAIAEPYERRLPGGFREQSWRPKRHPQAVRYAHIDPSLTGDASGICIAHIAGWTEVVRRDYHGEEYVELAPRIEADLVLGVVPPPGDEIMLSDMRAVLYQFVEHGFSIAYVSMDSFQSVDSIQQLKKRGIDAEVVSVDRTTDPYDVLKTTTYEDRLRIYPHRKATDEIRLLQRVIRPGGKVKVDHPKKNPDGTIGSKDVADAICGVVYSLTRKLPGRPMAMMASPRTERENQQDMTWALDGNLIPVDNNNVQTKRPNPGNMGAKRINDLVKNRAMPFMKG